MNLTTTMVSSISSIVSMLIGVLTKKKKGKPKMVTQPTAEHQLADLSPSPQIVEPHSSLSSSPQSTTSKSRKHKGKGKAVTSKPPLQELQIGQKFGESIAIGNPFISLLIKIF